MAESLCRLLLNSNLPLYLVDPDRVEEHNILRQNFFAADIGKFKAQALAERLSRQYGRSISYITTPYDGEMFDRRMGSGMVSKAISMLVIGCVDNAFARRSIAKSLEWDRWWLDSGNGHHSGQILLGNAKTKAAVAGAFHSRSQTVTSLPSPALQLPALLSPSTDPSPRQDCAEAVADNAQSPTINQMMAALLVDFVYRLLTNRLTWMGVYVDQEAGTLQPVQATPELVSRTCSIPVKELHYKAGSMPGGLRR